MESADPADVRCHVGSHQEVHQQIGVWVVKSLLKYVFDPDVHKKGN